MHPYCWGSPSEEPCSSSQSNVPLNETTELDLRRHTGKVSNYVYTDGHARNGNWNQLYWQRGQARTGNFAPQQRGLGDA